MNTLSYNVRSVWNRKVTSLCVTLSIMVAVFITAATSMLVAGIQGLFVGKAGPTAAIVLAKGAEQEFGGAIANASKSALLGLPQIRKTADGTPDASPEAMQLLNLERTDGSGGTNVVIRGLDTAGYRIRPSLRIVSGRMPKPGTNEAIVGTKIAGRVRGIALGEQLRFGTKNDLVIVGVFADDSAAESEIFADLNFVQAAFGTTGYVSSVRVELNSGADFAAFERAVADKPISAKAMRLRAFEEKQAGTLTGLVSFLGIALGALLSVAAVFGALVGMHGSIGARTRELGTMRALGFPRGTIMRGILVEALVLALSGAVLGAIGALALTPVQVPMMGPNWASVVLRFQPTPMAFVAAIVNALVIGLVGALMPALRALRIAPTQALRGG